MRTITTFIPATLFISFVLAAALFLTPGNAKAAVVDDLLVQVQSMMEQMAKMQIQLQALQAAQSSTQAPAATTPAGGVLGATSFKFTQDLSYGADNDDIFKIQQLLKTDSEIYPEGTVSGFFGPKTQEAIKNLQTRFGLDPVGVVGPATTALLERLISQKNSDGTYPSDILDPARPTGSVAGATTSTSNVPTNIQALLDQVEALQNQQTQPGSETKTTQGTNANSSGVDRIEVEVDDGESLVKVFYTSGKYKDFWAASEDEDDIIEETADELKLSESIVEDLIDFGKYKRKSSSDADDIDKIKVDVDVEEGVAEVTVIFEDEDEDDFEVEEVDLEDIIGEIADELDIDEDDVRDLIDVDYNVKARDIDEINVVVEDKEAEVTLELESGDDFEFLIDEDDEDDINEAIADLLDLDVEDVEDAVDFEFID